MIKIFSQISDGIHSFLVKLKIDTWLKSMGIDAAEAVRDCLGFVMGMLFGIVFKKYFKFILITGVVTIAVIKGLEYQHIIHIDYTSFKEFLGIDTQANLNSFGSDLVTWIQANTIAVIFTTVGFLLGLTIG